MFAAVSPNSVRGGLPTAALRKRLRTRSWPAAGGVGRQSQRWSGDHHEQNRTARASL